MADNKLTKKMTFKDCYITTGYTLHLEKKRRGLGYRLSAKITEVCAPRAIVLMANSIRKMYNNSCLLLKPQSPRI